jgi:hypothetical protein
MSDDKKEKELEGTYGWLNSYQLLQEDTIPLIHAVMVTVWFFDTF